MLIRVLTTVRFTSHQNVFWKQIESPEKKEQQWYIIQYECRFKYWRNINKSWRIRFIPSGDLSLDLHSKCSICNICCKLYGFSQHIGISVVFLRIIWSLLITLKTTSKHKDWFFTSLKLYYADMQTIFLHMWWVYITIVVDSLVRCKIPECDVDENIR